MTAPTSRKLALIGGFLGAGKTTLIQRFAAWLSANGLRPGLVANDQREILIDTATLATAGQNSVSEVTGGCFCCRLDELVSVLRRMEAELRPDVIIAEPVGSCTDLMATVLLPLEQVYGMPLVACPLSVVLDGRRALAALGGRRDPRDFHRDVGYIYRKQMEEAEWLVVNKIDLISSEQLADLQQRLAANFPDQRVFSVSGKSGEGLEAWFEALISEARKRDLLKAQRVEKIHGIRKEIAHFQDQWMILSREDAEFFVANDRTEAFEEVFAPDEAYFATVLAAGGRSPLVHCANRAVTWADWERGSAHPKGLMEVSARDAARMAESGCFFARKFPKGSDIGKFGLHRGVPGVR